MPLAVFLALESDREAAIALSLSWSPCRWPYCAPARPLARSP